MKCKAIARLFFFDGVYPSLQYFNEQTLLYPVERHDRYEAIVDRLK